MGTSRSTATARRHALDRVRDRLQRRASPRLHMTALVAATGAVGFAASAALLHAGMTTMAVRYPLALAIAYAAFLALVGLWLRRFRLHPAGHAAADRRARHASERDASDPGVLDVDVVEVPLGALLDAPPSAPSFAGFGEGGGFAGGGSADSWGDAAEASVATARSAAPAVAPARPASGDGGSGWSLDVDEDSVALVPVLLAALVALVAVGAAVYLVYSAPVLFAELLLDAGLAAGLYGRLARAERRSWLRTAVRGTLLPACAMALVLGFAGFVLQELVPGAASIGAVTARLRAP